MTGKSMLALDLTGGRLPKALGRASIGFHFWHYTGLSLGLLKLSHFVCSGMGSQANVI